MSPTEDKAAASRARIGVVGAGWWSQGWHLPCLQRNPEARIVAIVDVCACPKSSLNPELESLEKLGQRYGTQVFASVEDMMNNDGIRLSLDGVLIATPHASHYEVARSIISFAGKPFNILMEKPMSTDIRHAIEMHRLFSRQSYEDPGPSFAGSFWINHSANFRPQARLARQTVASGGIGSIRHITAFLHHP